MNARVKALVDLARKYGQSVYRAQNNGDCWLISAPMAEECDPHLVVYSAGKSGATVHRRENGKWKRVSQAHARILLVNHALGPQHLWNTGQADVPPCEWGRPKDQCGKRSVGLYRMTIDHLWLCDEHKLDDSKRM